MNAIEENNKTKLISDNFNQLFNHSKYDSTYCNEVENKFNKDFNNYIEKIKNINYVILSENPLNYETYVYNSEGSGNWISSINKAFKINKKHRIEEWLDKGILVLDIYQLFAIKNKDVIGIKIQSDDRKELINYKINDLPYAVYRTILTFEYLNEILEGKYINKNCKLAIMMPQLTSLPIFNYFNKYQNEIIIKEINFSRFFRITNPVNMLSEYPTTIIPLFKINTIGANNTSPDTNLIKIALDL